MGTKIVTEICDNCKGAGQTQGHDTDGGETGMDGCFWCGGKGNTQEKKWFKRGSGNRRVVLKEVPCYTCKGSGEEIVVHSFAGNDKYGRCHSCSGSGKTWEHDHYVD